MQDRIGMRQTFSVHSTMYAGILYRLNRVCAADNIRARAVGVATVVNWSANLTVSATFLSLMETIGFDGTFLIYTCVGVSGVSTQASGRNTSAKAGNCSAACMYYDGFYQVCVCVCG
eukprot:m.609676 g.609676  ORF g.609676 m.609676 type:complete len:117 (+) comp22490_c0_seq12:2587-2937(+)